MNITAGAGSAAATPTEEHRASTPLELLYDLTIVVAFGTAADELAHYVAEGHAAAGVARFAFGAFAVSWAWLNYSWFASAYDTDDWLFRLATMVQMIGVVVLSLGLPQLFASIDHGDTPDNHVVVAGYVVMRTALVFLWWQVSRHDPQRRRTARSYMTLVGLAQVGWVALAIAGHPDRPDARGVAVLVAFELAAPFIAERKGGTPWHPHHIAERYGLLVIITLGEVIIGTVAALNALVHGEAGWSVDAALLAARRRRPHVRVLVDVLRGALGRAARRPPRARVPSSATGTSWSSPRSRPWARGSTSPPSAWRTRRRSARRRRSSASPSRSRSTRAVFYALYSVLMRDARPVPPGSDRRHDRHPGPGGRARRGGREHGRLPDRADASRRR